MIPICLFLPLETFVSAVSAKSASFNQIWQMGCRILLSVISLTFVEICDLVDMRGRTDVPFKGKVAIWTNPFLDTRESTTARDSINIPSVENLNWSTNLQLEDQAMNIIGNQVSLIFQAWNSLLRNIKVSFININFYITLRSSWRHVSWT